jgi:predicted phosphodiesterase
VAIAALADIHGNVQALDAVLADRRLPQRIVVLGDIVAGTFPAESFDRLKALGERVRILRGNADRIVLERDGNEAERVYDQLGPERVAAIERWPLTFVVSIPGLGDARCCHAVPGDDEEIVTKLTPDEDIAAALEGTAEALVLAGHTHTQLDRHVGSRRFVNVGSVGRPYEERPGAYWALLGPDVEFVRTDYDIQAAAAAVLQSGQPRALDVVNTLLSPPMPGEAAAEFEAMRGP